MEEEKKLETKKKGNGLLITIIVLLVIIILLLGFYICYDKGIIFQGNAEKDKEATEKKEKTEDKKDWWLSLEIFQSIVCLIAIILAFFFCKFMSNGKELMTQAIEYFESMSIEESEIENVKETVMAFFSFDEDVQN